MASIIEAKSFEKTCVMASTGANAPLNADGAAHAANASRPRENDRLGSLGRLRAWTSAGVDSLLAIGISTADDLQILLSNSIEAQAWSPGN